jgi:DNA-binding XRE family transcriptional regulator
MNIYSFQANQPGAICPVMGYYEYNPLSDQTLRLFKRPRLTGGLSQQDLELIAEISKNQVGNIERGEVNITLITATAIAKALNISLKELFDY